MKGVERSISSPDGRDLARSVSPSPCEFVDSSRWALAPHIQFDLMPWYRASCPVHPRSDNTLFKVPARLQASGDGYPVVPIQTVQKVRKDLDRL